MRTLYAEELSAEEEAELLYGSPIVDSNQQHTFDNIVQRLFDTNPNGDPTDMIRYAAEQARKELETAEVAARKIADIRKGPAYCYMAFHGLGATAQFAKVGMTRHPEQRMYDMATGNPLDCLWVFVCRASSVRAAYRIEQGLLRHLEPQKRRGEWITLGSLDADGAAALARSMSGLASTLDPESEGFELLSYRDGRQVA